MLLFILLLSSGMNAYLLVTAYKCTAWCTTTETIPKTLEIKVLQLHLADLAWTYIQTKCKCVVLYLFLYVVAIMEPFLFWYCYGNLSDSILFNHLY
jgi:hypothetical protein